MAPDMTWKGSIRCFIFFYLKTGYIAHNRHNRPKKARQSEKKTNKKTIHRVEQKKKAKSKEQEWALNKLLLFVCLFYN